MGGRKSDRNSEKEYIPRKNVDNWALPAMPGLFAYSVTARLWSQYRLSRPQVG